MVLSDFFKNMKNRIFGFFDQLHCFEMSHALSSQNDYDLHAVGKGIGNLQLGRCKFP